MIDLPFRPAKQLAALIRGKKVGCLELLETYIARMEKYNPRLNAIIATDLESARRRARAADRALARKEVWGPLHGVPMTIKESYDVVGMPTTWGVPELKDNYPKRNALAVDRLLRAGVVLFGKTNVPLYLADWQSYNSIYEAEVRKLTANGVETRNEIMDFHNRKLVFISGPEGITVELSEWH